MKAKPFVYTCSLIWAVLYFSRITAAEIQVGIATPGVEVKRYNSTTWEIVAKGVKLQNEDTVRVPPNAIFRVTTEEGSLKIRSAQEGLLSVLMEEEGQSKRRTSRLDRTSPERSYIKRTRQQVGDQPDELENVSSVVTPQRLNLNELHALAKVDDDSLFRDALEELASYHDNDYPYRNFGSAWKLFKKIADKVSPTKEKIPEKTPQSATQTWEKKKGDEIDIAILFYALLHRLGIPTKFEIGTDGVLIVLVNSGKTDVNINHITVNPDLYENRTAGDKEEAWLPVRFVRQNGRFNNNFIVGWDEGGRAISRLKSN